MKFTTNFSIFPNFPIFPHFPCFPQLPTHPNRPMRPIWPINLFLEPSEANHCANRIQCHIKYEHWWGAADAAHSELASGSLAFCRPQAGARCPLGQNYPPHFERFAPVRSRALRGSRAPARLCVPPALWENNCLIKFMVIEGGSLIAYRSLSDSCCSLPRALTWFTANLR